MKALTCKHNRQIIVLSTWAIFYSVILWSLWGLIIARNFAGITTFHHLIKIWYGVLGINIILTLLLSRFRKITKAFLVTICGLFGLGIVLFFAIISSPTNADAAGLAVVAFIVLFGLVILGVSVFFYILPFVLLVSSKTPFKKLVWILIVATLVSIIYPWIAFTGAKIEYHNKLKNLEKKMGITLYTPTYVPYGFKKESVFDYSVGIKTTYALNTYNGGTLDITSEKKVPATTRSFPTHCISEIVTQNGMVVCIYGRDNLGLGGSEEIQAVIKKKDMYLYIVLQAHRPLSELQNQTIKVIESLKPL